MFRMLKLLPPHGWRAVWWELGIVTLGVLIALAAQQVAEEAHWRRATRQAVESMKADALDERGAILARYDQRHCIDRRLAEIGALFARHDAGELIGRIGKVGRPFYSSGSAPSWEVAVADGSLAHLNFAQRQVFANAFDIYALYAAQMWEEKRAWQQLQMLNHVASFTPADWSQARQAFNLASDFQASFRITLPEYIESFATIAPPGPHKEDRPNNPFKTHLCRPLFVGTSE